MRPVTHRASGPQFAGLRVSRRGGSLLVLALVGPLAGCYTTRPVTTAPAPGATVLLDLTDVARVQFGERIGASAARIEGVVQSQNDTAYVINISSVSYLDGRTNKWSGEPFTVPAQLVSRAQLREFSRSRTSLLSAGIAAALVVVFATTQFLGLGGAEKTPIPPPGGES
ncbi:MAG: hypothetical protein JWN79_2902 [Gemmatimonadetes bacterium]|jgi:hypothetical protein|nr:hypothetical protein [Gemmatimonadota bacterium]